jgi:hypothetical protein
MKKAILLFVIAISTVSLAQSDSLEVVDTTEKEPIHFYEVDLLSRNVWRGIDFGNYSPTIVGVFGISPVEGLEFGVVGIASLTGTNVGYGNTFNVYASYSRWGFTLTLDDYYFNGDPTNLDTKFFDWDNTHFLEARLKYEYKGFYAIAGYTVAGGNMYHIRSTNFNNRNGAYIETGYEGDHIGVCIGGITGPSALNFHDKSGITNVRFKYMNTLKKLNDLPFEIGVSYNPNFDYIAPLDLPRVGYGRSAFNFYVGLIFD